MPLRLGASAVRFFLPIKADLLPTRLGYPSLLVGLHLCLGLLELLDVRGRELRRFELDGDLVDLAGELERDLVVLVVHGCEGGVAVVRTPSSGSHVAGEYQIGDV